MNQQKTHIWKCSSSDLTKQINITDDAWEYWLLARKSINPISYPLAQELATAFATHRAFLLGESIPTINTTDFDRALEIASERECLEGC